MFLPGLSGVEVPWELHNGVLDFRSGTYKCFGNCITDSVIEGPARSRGRVLRNRVLEFQCDLECSVTHLARIYI